MQTLIACMNYPLILAFSLREKGRNFLRHAMYSARVPSMCCARRCANHEKPIPALTLPVKGKETLRSRRRQAHDAALAAEGDDVELAVVPPLRVRTAS